MTTIPRELIQSYCVFSSSLLNSCSKNLFIAIADNGGRYLDRGIKEGTRLIFDAEKPFKRGELSCFVDANKKLHLLTTRRKGYTHLGRLVGMLSAF